MEMASMVARMAILPQLVQHTPWPIPDRVKEKLSIDIRKSKMQGIGGDVMTGISAEYSKIFYLGRTH